MVELFSGIGAQAKGFKDSNLFELNVVATSDIDKDAIVSYASIHNNLSADSISRYNDYPTEDEMKNELLSKNIGFDYKKNVNTIKRVRGDKLKKYWLATKLSNNMGDISNIKSLPLVDIWTYSFPCQDISLAGRMNGIVRGITRSGLLYEVERLLEQAKETNTLPKYLLLENVKNLVGGKFKIQFDDWLLKLDELGFNTYWKVVNAKNCGIPQNRERVFAFSIRKDIDIGQFKFMKPFDNGLRLIDFLEDNVDSKYYLSKQIQDRFKLTDNTFQKNVIGTTKGDDCTRIGNRDLVYKEDGIMGCLSATDYKQPKQIINNTNKCIQSYVLSGGKWDNIYESARRCYSENGISPTIHTCAGGNIEPKVVLSEQTIDYCIRKLTPKECWLLMGFTSEDYDKAFALGLSDSLAYKQAGNSIVTNCIELIAEHLYKAQYNNEFTCYDETV